MTAPMLILGALLLPLLAALLIGLSHAKPLLRDVVCLASALLLPLLVLPLVDPVLAGVRPSLILGQLLPGLEIRFEVEPLGLLFAGVAALLWPINTLYSIGYMRANQESHQTRFYICFAIALSSTLWVAYAGNLLTLFIGYEMLTLSTYPLVVHQGDRQSIRAGRVYLGLLLASSIGLLLPAMLWTWHRAGTLDFVPGGILAGHLDGWLVGGLLLLFVYGTAKAALMPIHRWLPAAMVAPTPVSALLHAVAVVKAGVFTIVKLLLYVFGVELLQQEASSHWLLYVAGLSILVASVIALRQDNLKLRLAYSTISQLGYVVLAVAILAPLSVVGAALHIAAHAFAKITLFFAAGAIYTSSHRVRVSQLNGIGRRMPWTMAAFSIAALSMIGVPPTAGFLSKWYILMGAFEAEQMLAVLVVVISTLLNAAYFVPIIYAAYFKPADESANEPTEHGEAPRLMLLALAASASLTLLLFLFPALPLGLATAILEPG